MARDFFEMSLTSVDVGILTQFGIQSDEGTLHELPPKPDEVPSDEEIVDALMREMGIEHLPRDEVLRTVREFFSRTERKPTV